MFGAGIEETGSLDRNLATKEINLPLGRASQYIDMVIGQQLGLCDLVLSAEPYRKEFR